MARSRIFIAGVIALSAAIAASAAPAQTPPAGTEAPKPSRLKLTKRHMEEMLAKWRQNRPKLKACRAEAHKKGLAGDDRWFFLSECMEKP